MEKAWKDFWTTGKVEDYLTYRNRVEDYSRDETEDCHRQNGKEEKRRQQYYDADHNQSLR